MPYEPIRVDGGKSASGIGIEPIQDSDFDFDDLLVDPDAPSVDEHLGFKKLEGELAHENGVKSPAAVAAKIGMEKYGKSGMEKKAAAGRKDAATPMSDAQMRSAGLVRKAQ